MAPLTKTGKTLRWGGTGLSLAAILGLAADAVMSVVQGGDLATVLKFAGLDLLGMLFFGATGAAAYFGGGKFRKPDLSRGIDVGELELAYRARIHDAVDAGSYGDVRKLIDLWDQAHCTLTAEDEAQGVRPGG